MKKSVGIIIILIYAVMITAGLLTAFLVASLQDGSNHTIGEVQIELVMYYEKDDIIYPIQEVYIDQDLNLKKPGVYFINVVDGQAIEFIENLRIELLVYSNVDTYVRIELLDTLILRTENYLGVKTEIPITTPTPTDFYTTSDWYDNRTIDGFYYYKNTVKRASVSTPALLQFIPSYFEGINYNARSFGYEIQLGVRVEAVQAHLGPQYNWDLNTPPWGGSWA